MCGAAALQAWRALSDADRHYSLLESIVGSDNILGPTASTGFAVCGASPAVASVLPGSVAEVQEIIRCCAGHHLSIIAEGGATMMGRASCPASFDVAVSMKRLSRVTDYQPENLVFASEAGLTGAAAAEALAGNRQLVTLDPPRFADATMGGITASRASGPARLQYGTPRDLVIGLTVVDAAGDIVRTGGKVVKSVSGYDLCKLYTGSLGTLGLIVETVYRLSPMPETSRAVVVGADSWEQADALTARVLDSVLQPRCLEVMNAPAAVRLCQGQGRQFPVTILIGFDGSHEQVDYQCRAVTAMAESCNARDAAETDLAWNESMHARLANLDAAGPGDSLFVVRCLSSDIPIILARVDEAFRGSTVSPLVMASAGNGIVRIRCEGCDSALSRAAMTSLRQLSDESRSVTVHWFPADGASHQDTWGANVPGLPVMRAIKAKLDPSGVFAAGRFAGGL